MTLLEPALTVDARLGSLWSQILDVETIAPDDNFFALGGQSHLLVRLLANIEAEFGVALSPAAVFERPTLAHVAEQIARAKAKPSGAVLPVARGHVSKRASVVQEQCLVRHPNGYDPCNICYEAVLSGMSDPKRLQEAFSATVENNRVAKYVFAKESQHVVVAVPHKSTPHLVVLDLQGRAQPYLDGEIASHRTHMFGTAFDLWREPAFRATFLSLSRTEGVLLFCASRIVLDASSLAILVAEVYARYAGSMIPPKEFDFYDFAEWERSRLPPAPEALNELSGTLRRSPLTGSVVRSFHQVTDRAALRFLRMSQEFLPVPHIRMLALVALALSRDRTEPLSISCPIAIRRHPRAADVVGNFSRQEILLVNLSGTDSLRYWLARLHQHNVGSLEQDRDTQARPTPLPSLTNSVRSDYQVELEFRDQFMSRPQMRREQLVRSSVTTFERPTTDLHLFVDLQQSSVEITVTHDRGRLTAQEVSELSVRVGRLIGMAPSCLDASLGSLIRQL